jgi:putative salt-induced outer membrane protein
MEIRMQRSRFAAVLLALALPASLLAQAPAGPAWKTTGTFDLGYVSATGNTDVTTINFGDKIVATYADWSVTQMLAQVHAKTKGVESANQLRAGLRVERRLTSVFGGFGAVQYERNAFAGFDRRMDELLGMTWKAFADSSNLLSFEGGAVFTQQDNSDGTNKNSTSARGAMAYKYNFRPAAYFSQNAEYIADLEESGAYRTNLVSAIVAPLSRMIGIKLGYTFQYNSRPPATFGTTDRIMTAGLQLSF